ncbi:MAG: peroxiredoxin [Minicystis sp.]
MKNSVSFSPVALLALVALVTLSGCNDPPPSAATSTSKPAPSAAASVASAAPAVMLKEGDAAPDLELTLQTGKTVKLSSLKGKTVAIYFYPKDDTPGCTVEAQGIRDNWEQLAAANITVIGVSLQDAASHQQFIDKYKLPFDLAVDTTGAVARAFGVPVHGEYASRQTFLIGPDGKIKKVWPDVKPSGHAAEILAAAKS